MKATTTKQALLAALDRCAVATTAERGHAPHAGKVLLSASVYEDGESVLRAYATDAVLQVDTVAAAGVERPGSVAVNCKRLIAAAASMPEGKLALKFASGRLVLSGPSTPRGYGLPAMVGADFPTPQEPRSTAAHIELPAAILSRVVRRVQPVIEPRGQPHLAGVRIETEAGTVRAIALSNHAFAICPDQVAGLAEGWGAFIPWGALKLLVALCDDHEQLTLIDDAPRVFIQSPETLVGGLIPEGNYPPWQNLLQHLDRQPIARVPRLMMQEALRAVTVARDNLASPVRVTIRGAELTVSLEKDDSDASDRLQVEPLGESDYSVLIDPLLLTDVVRGADADFTIAGVAQGPLVATDDGYIAVAARRREQDPPEPPPAPES